MLTWNTYKFIRNNYDHTSQLARFCLSLSHKKDDIRRNRFMQCTLKWDLCIWEPPSELLTQIESHPSPSAWIMYRWMKLWRPWRLTSHSQNLIMDNTKGQNSNHESSLEEYMNNYWWHHRADNFLTQTFSFSQLNNPKPETNTFNITCTSACHIASSKSPCQVSSTISYIKQDKYHDVCWPK